MKEYWERFKSELKLIFYKDSVMFSPYFMYGKWCLLEESVRFKSYKEAVEYSKKKSLIKFFYIDEYNTSEDYKEYWNE